MNTDDINLAYKLRHALNENLDALPVSTTERLAAARALALSRKKADAPRQAPQAKRPLFDIKALFTGPALARIAVAALSVTASIRSSPSVGSLSVSAGLLHRP